MKARNRLETALRRALTRNGYHCGAMLVVACSGGPDSTALLHGLLSLRDDFGLSLRVAHLNHDFRGEEAEEDARFVATMAEGLALPHTVAKADPMAYQREHGISSFEEAAREVRYNFLAEAAGRAGADAIVLGHTAGDQAETTLMNLLRGAGIHGLRGMRERSRWLPTDGGPEATLFRPLLEVSRRDTLAYCREGDIPYRTDSTNACTKFTRNRVRRRLLPEMEGYNPRVREALRRTGRAAAAAADYFESELDRLWPSLAGREGETVILDRHRLEALHPYLRTLALRRAYGQAAGSLRRLSERHLSGMSKLADGPSNRRLDLPGAVVIRTLAARITLGPAQATNPSPAPPPLGATPLRVPGVTQVPGWVVTVEFRQPGAGIDVGLGPYAAVLDAAALEGAVVRARRPGDVIQPLGMTGRKKVKDLLIDLKVPRERRDRVPLLVSPRGVLWVVPYRLSALTRVGPPSQAAAVVRWRRVGEG